MALSHVLVRCSTNKVEAKVFCFSKDLMERYRNYKTVESLQKSSRSSGYLFVVLDKRKNLYSVSINTSPINGRKNNLFRSKTFEEVSNAAAYAIFVLSSVEQAFEQQKPLVDL